MSYFDENNNVGDDSDDEKKSDISSEDEVSENENDKIASEDEAEEDAVEEDDDDEDPQDLEDDVDNNKAKGNEMGYDEGEEYDEDDGKLRKPVSSLSSDSEDDAGPVASKKKTKKIPITTKQKASAILADEEEDDDDPSGEVYLQKFDKEINDNYLVNIHPESAVHNYDEILVMTKVVRDKNGIIIDDLHKTIPYLTKYERARILGQRAKQINSGASVFVKVPEKVIDGYLIAELELIEKRIPFIIRRPLPNGGSEYWSIKDLENISF